MTAAGGTKQDDRRSAAEGFVLVGGRSSRFGSDKAAHAIDGRPMALLVAEAIRPCVASVTLVGDASKYASFGLPAITDRTPRSGPLGGIVAALDHACAPLCLIVACDMPRVGSAPLAALLREAARTGADAVVPKTGDGRLQPLCAVYAKRAAPPLARALRDGTRKVADALGGLDWKTFAVEDADAFLNVNRIGDLKTLGRLAASGR